MAFLCAMVLLLLVAAGQWAAYEIAQCHEDRNLPTPAAWDRLWSLPAQPAAPAAALLDGWGGCMCSRTQDDMLNMLESTVSGYAIKLLLWCVTTCYAVCKAWPRSR
eukprot:3325025-Alexandrium_andersonii.AAC.1